MSNVIRCAWAGDDPLYIDYHDNEWGRPVHDDDKLFEMLIQEEFGSFDAFLWRYVDGKSIQNHWPTISDVPATTELSDRISKELKKRGFKFVGSTIVYAYMQAVGLVNDHSVDCFVYVDELGNNA